MLQITTKIGDSPLLAIPLVSDVRNDSTAFSPGSAYTLLLTAKTKLTDLDAAAKFQLALGAGITVSGTSALCQLAAAATIALAPDNLYWDIRATHLLTGDTHIIAEGRWRLERPATRLPASSVAIYTVQPFAGFAIGGGAQDAFGTAANADGGLDLTLWNATQAKYQRLRITGAPGLERLIFI